MWIALLTTMNINRAGMIETRTGHILGRSDHNITGGIDRSMITSVRRVLALHDA